MTDRISGMKIQGVAAESAVVQQVGVATYWTAEQDQARKAIRKAFTGHEKAQWAIGDLLNVIAPSKGDGVDNPEATARLKQVAEENGKAVTTLRAYRQVSNAYALDERDQFRTWQDALDALRAKSEKDEADKAAPAQLLTKLLKLIDGLKGKELDEHDRVSLRALRLAVDTLLNDEEGA